MLSSLDGADICLETDSLPSTCPSVVDLVFLVTHEIDFDLGRCFAEVFMTSKGCILVKNELG